MKKKRFAISGTVLAIGLSIGAGAFAQTGLTASPNPLNLSARGGQLASAWVTITNHGPGFASNLAVSIPTGAHNGSLTVIGDTCTGATLAQGGTCSVRFEYESKCYYKVGLADTYGVAITSSQFPALIETVNGTNLSYSCD
ncbi:MAG TPA: hypothetical protein VIP05_17805 [Burkholderiaceae bacterium]